MKNLFLLLLVLLVMPCQAAIYQNYWTTNAAPQLTNNNGALSTLSSPGSLVSSNQAALIAALNANSSNAVVVYHQNGTLTYYTATNNNSGRGFALWTACQPGNISSYDYILLNTPGIYDMITNRIDLGNYRNVTIAGLGPSVTTILATNTDATATNAAQAGSPDARFNYVTNMTFKDFTIYADEPFAQLETDGRAPSGLTIYNVEAHNQLTANDSADGALTDMILPNGYINNLTIDHCRFYPCWDGCTISFGGTNIIINDLIMFGTGTYSAGYGFSFDGSGGKSCQNVVIKNTYIAMTNAVAWASQQIQRQAGPTPIEASTGSQLTLVNDTLYATNTWAGGTNYNDLIMGSGATATIQNVNLDTRYVVNPGGTNITALGQFSETIVTNVSSATSIVLQFPVGFQDTNYAAIFELDGSAITSTYPSAKTATTVQANFGSASGKIVGTLIHQ